jgi:ATP-dependent Clp protease adaptor protein ClpS
MIFASTSPKSNPQEDLETLIESGWVIVLYNDEVNSFDWVITNLVKYCGHSRLQAEQCAWFVHNNGKYAVKKGSYEDMEPICKALCEKGLSAELEVQ